MSEKVVQGERFQPRADTWNSMVDAARGARASRQPRAVAARSALLRADTQSVSVLAHNDGATEIAQGGIVGIDGAVLAHADNPVQFVSRPVVSVVEPALTHAGAWAIAAGPMPVGAVGRVVVAGVAACQVEMLDAAHQYAEMEAGNVETLVSAATGRARLLAAPTYPATGWALVLVGSGSGGTTPGELFAVRVWQDGGTTDGDEDNQCDRTYTVRTIDSVSVLGEAMTPLKPRPTLGTLIVPPVDGYGDYGVGFYDESSVFQLWDAGEVLDVESCTGTGT